MMDSVFVALAPILVVALGGLLLMLTEVLSVRKDGGPSSDLALGSFIALLAGALGFTGIAGAATGIAKVLFFVFLVVWVLALVSGRRTQA